MKKPTIIGSDRFPGTTGKQSSGLTVSIASLREMEESLLKKEIIDLRAIAAKHFSFLIEQAKAEIELLMLDPALSGSLEEKLSNYKERLAIEITQGGPSAQDYEFYGHLRFLFTDKSPEDLRAAAHAYKNSLKFDPSNVRTMVFFARATEELERLERQATAPKIPLPEEEKRAIENQPYGKQPRAAEMSDKVQDAIRKGISAGEFIRREMIKPSGQKQEDIAEKINVHQASLSYVLNGRTSLSPEMAAKLSHHFQTYTTEELLTLQAAHDAKKADQAYLASLPEHKDPTPV